MTCPPCRSPSRCAIDQVCLDGELPPGQAECPVCEGTTRRPWPEHQDRRYASVTATYDKATDTLACNNCGWQSMSLAASGMTRIDPATGRGCVHTYRGQKAGNCYVIYTCTKCGDRYDIDSGD